MFRATSLTSRVGFTEMSPFRRLFAPHTYGPRVKPVARVDMVRGCTFEDSVVPARETGDLTPLPTIINALHAAADSSGDCLAAAVDHGFDGRVLIIHSGIDRRVLINPVVTRRSQSYAHDWHLDADSGVAHRVARHRNVSIKYTTLDGDVEEWYDLPSMESMAIQKALDTMDGVMPSERVSPCVVQDPSSFPAGAVSCGVIASVSADLYASHVDKLRTLNRLA